jgi:hypothetical protein
MVQEQVKQEEKCVFGIKSASPSLYRLLEAHFFLLSIERVT